MQAKWVSNWRGHGTLKSIVGHHGWLARKTFKILDALEWLNRQHFDHGDSLLIVSPLKLFVFSLCFPFFVLLGKKWRGEHGHLVLALAPSPIVPGVTA